MENVLDSFISLLNLTESSSGKPEKLIFYLFLMQVYFLDIPDEVIDSLVNCLEKGFKNFYIFSTNFTKFPQIEEGVPFNVAGGLMLEHPLILPLVDTVVSLSLSLSGCPMILFCAFPVSLCYHSFMILLYIELRSNCSRRVCDNNLNRKQPQCQFLNGPLLKNMHSLESP